MQRGESPLCGLGRGFSAVWKGRIRGWVRPICCVRFGSPLRCRSGGGGRKRRPGQAVGGRRSAIWARTGAAVWCQAETGGMEDKRNGAPGPVWLRGSVVEGALSCPERVEGFGPVGAAGVGRTGGAARSARQERGWRGRGTGPSAAVPPCSRADESFSSARLPGACRPCGSFAGGPQAMAASAGSRAAG